MFGFWSLQSLTSVYPSWSSSVQLGFVAQSVSSQSVFPSQSLSVLSPQLFSVSGWLHGYHSEHPPSHSVYLVCVPPHPQSLITGVHLGS